MDTPHNMATQDSEVLTLELEIEQENMEEEASCKRKRTPSPLDDDEPSQPIKRAKHNDDGLRDLQMQLLVSLAQTKQLCTNVMEKTHNEATPSAQRQPDLNELDQEFIGFSNLELVRLNGNTPYIFLDMSGDIWVYPVVDVKQARNKLAGIEEYIAPCKIHVSILSGKSIQLICAAYLHARHTGNITVCDSIISSSAEYLWSDTTRDAQIDASGEDSHWYDHFATRGFLTE
jgi:hypothetical protein